MTAPAPTPAHQSSRSSRPTQPSPVPPKRSLGRAVGGGLAWSTVSNLVLRVGSLATGIVLARILAPEQFGVYAVALTVQSVLMTLADLGLSADLIRSPDHRRLAPTVASLGLTVGGALTIVMIATAQPVANLMGSPAASGAIAVLAVTLVLGSAGVVPYAALQRRFAQRQLFVIALIDFVVGTGITLGLLALGWGVMALAVGRVVAQTVTLVLQFVFARERPRYGFDRSVARAVLAFGIPVAGANVLSWSLLNIDNVVIAHVVGATALGFYVLAFNISNWPMSAIGQIVRSIALPLFSRTEGGGVLPATAALTWAIALPAGGFLAVLAAPLIVVVYGEKWLPSASVLAALGLFGALRALFDLFASFLLARGASRAVLWTQLVWFVALIPALIVATTSWGIVGAGWVHLGVSLVFVLPAYFIALRRADVSLVGLLRACIVPTVAMLPAAAAGLLVGSLLPGALLALLGGGLAGGIVYAACVLRWFLRRARAAMAAGRDR